MTLLELPIVECAGSPRALGRAQGEALRERIRAFMDQRLTAFAAYSQERGGPGVPEFLAAGARCFAAFEAWDAEGALEQRGIAEGAGVEAAALYGTTNMTDVRDVLLLPASRTDEGCTSLLVPASRASGGQVLVGQTWDLNPTDLDFVVAVHRRPQQGLETWSVTCAGALSLTGMNAKGVTVGTTNIKTRRSRIGVGYLSLLHRAIRAGSAAEARRLVSEAPRAAAHTYWLADAQQALELECDPDTVIERRVEREPLARTNHCLAGSMRALEGEAATVSSQKRLARAESWLRAAPQDVASLQALMRDRSDGVDSINRYTEDEQGTTTNACLVAVPASRTLWACRGPADRGRWVQLKFSS
jgi:isopenicillin-N N-acyltransferase-like protein